MQLDILWCTPAESAGSAPTVPGASITSGGAMWAAVVAQARRQKPDFVFLDPAAIDFRGRPIGDEYGRQGYWQFPVLIVGRAPHPYRVALAIANGARGYIDGGTTPAPPPAQQEVTEPVFPPGAAELKVTAREIQVLTGMSQGKSNGDIGRELFLSEDTVKTHARRIFRKLGARDRANAVLQAMRLELIP